MKLKVILYTRKSKEGKYKNSRDVVHPYAYITTFPLPPNEVWTGICNGAGTHPDRVWNHSVQAPGVSEVLPRHKQHKQEKAT